LNFFTNPSGPYGEIARRKRLARANAASDFATELGVVMNTKTSSDL